jgi:hypothetical protein
MTDPFLQTCLKIVVANLRCLVDRYRRAGTGLIDMKFDARTGMDFAGPESAGTIRGPEVVYTWIQGRGLEAAAGHCEWLARKTAVNKALAEDLTAGLHELMRSTATRMEAIRSRNGGRLCFMMSTSGEPLRVGTEGRLEPLPDMPREPGFVDLFYGKGLLAAGACLGDAELRDAGIEHLSWALGEIAQGRFISDQQPMDPKNPVSHDPERASHAPFMISLGALCLLIQHTQEKRWLDTARDFVDRIVNRHVVDTPRDGLRQWDFMEFVRPDGGAYLRDGQVPCDPGHTLEFVGLACKVLSTGEGVFGRQQTALLRKQCRPCLPGVFNRAFSLGFRPDVQGICKSVDLLSRKAINTDMPWWSLPETMRAGILLARLFGGSDEVRADGGAVHACLRALRECYCNPDVNFIAVQTRDGNGRVADVIPACPDVDPCYHTGLSLLDVLRCCPAR